jgi:hypothetical protein
MDHSRDEFIDGKAMPMTPSRRATRRTGLKGAAVVLLPGNVARDAQMCDLSSEGLSVMSARPISPGSRCTVNFELPFGDGRSPALSVATRSLYSSYTGDAGFKVGMVFTALDAPAQALIDEFLG